MTKQYRLTMSLVPLQFPAVDSRSIVQPAQKSHLDTLGLEEGVYELEAPLHAAGLDIRVGCQSLLQLIHLTHRQRRGGTVLLQSEDLVSSAARQASSCASMDQQ